MLLNLPNEMLRQIVAGLTPDDLINTALSCKTVYNFCKDNGDLERHLAHQKAYTVLNLGSHGMDPLDLMEIFNEDWRVAYYVKAVHFKCPQRGPLFARRPHGDVRYLMNNAVHADEAMLALLAPILLLLPNMARLRFIDFSRQPPGLKDLVRRLDPRTSFSKLEVIEFVKSKRPTNLELEWREDTSSFKNAFNPWSSLFSVNTLRAENVIWNEELATYRFQITALELINCSIELDGLERFLACCMNLRRFTYDWNLVQNFNGLFDEGGLFWMLSSCCGESLEYVRLTGELPPITFMSDTYRLRGLHRLKQAHLSLELFVAVGEGQEDWYSSGEFDINEWRFPVLALDELLPPSTEEITIDFRKTGFKHELKELLGCLVSGKYSQYSRSRLPLLKSVVIESDKLTADEAKKLTQEWQEKSTTLKIEFRLIDI